MPSNHLKGEGGVWGRGGARWEEASLPLF